MVRRLISDERGATAIEYGLVGVLVVVAMVGSLRVVGGRAHAMWDYVSTNVSAVSVN